MKKEKKQISTGVESDLRRRSVTDKVKKIKNNKTEQV